MYSFDLYKSRNLYNLYPYVKEFKYAIDTQEILLRDVLNRTGLTIYELAHKSAVKYDKKSSSVLTVPYSM